MQRLRWLVAGLAISGGIYAPAICETVVPALTDSSLASPPDSLSLANAATFEDTLAVLERSLRAFEMMEGSMPKSDAGVFEELIAAMRDSYDTGDIEAASILSADAWEIVRTRPR